MVNKVILCIFVFLDVKKAEVLIRLGIILIEDEAQISPEEANVLTYISQSFKQKKKSLWKKRKNTYEERLGKRCVKILFKHKSSIT